MFIHQLCSGCPLGPGAVLGTVNSWELWPLHPHRAHGLEGTVTEQQPQWGVCAQRRTFRVLGEGRAGGHSRPEIQG